MNLHALFRLCAACGALSMLASLSTATKLCTNKPANYSAPPSAQEWDQAELKASALVSQLNLTEKATLVTGSLQDGVGTGCIGRIRSIERVGFQGLCFLDGPSAVNRAHFVSVFPSGMTVAASWDRDLMYQRAVAIAKEFKAKGGHVILGPTAGPLGRHALGGRNWEAFSPDPYLTGEAMMYTILGHQSVGVQTSSKHLLGNEQETQRMPTVVGNTPVHAISSDMDDRTLHELYLWPFANAIRAGTTSVMCSYNRLNSTYACENSRLLTEILRDELGFRGFTVSDWFATHSTVEAANAGLDMEQPGDVPPAVQSIYGGGFYGSKLAAAVEAGLVSEQRIDEMARNLLTPYYLLNQDSPQYPQVDGDLPFLLAISNGGWESPYIQNLGPSVPGRDVRKDHHRLILHIGASAAVLLKNEGNLLPLGAGRNTTRQSIRNIGVFGDAAIPSPYGLVYSESYSLQQSQYGPLSIGGGAGSGRNPYLISPLEAITQRAENTGALVQHLASHQAIAENDFRSIYPLPDICLLFLKSWAAEGLDRTSLELDNNSTVVVDNVARFCGPNRLVVITNSAGVNSMPWADNANVSAILSVHYPGQEIGNSIADVLWGDTEPSGRLPYSVPKSPQDYIIPIVNLTDASGHPELDSSKWHANFSEGLIVDYRHFDTYGIQPKYEFGSGLGYTTFDLRGPLRITKLATIGPKGNLPSEEARVEPGGNTDLWEELLLVTVRTENTGERKGSTVVQLYVTMPQVDNLGKNPLRVLRGFSKMELAPGEVAEVSFRLARRDLSYWDVALQKWRIPAGEFRFAAGFSSRDLRANATEAVYAP